MHKSLEEGDQTQENEQGDYHGRRRIRLFGRDIVKNFGQGSRNNDCYTSEGVRKHVGIGRTLRIKKMSEIGFDRSKQPIRGQSQ